MYRFNTLDGRTLTTAYSPKEISKFYCFDCLDDETSVVIERENVDFKSFEFLEL